MNNIELFLQKYKALEKWARTAYPECEGRLEDVAELAEYGEQLKFFRLFRNVLTHSYQIGLEDKKMASISKKFIDRFDALNKNLRTTVSQIAIPRTYIFTKSWEDKVLDTMRVMQQNEYTTIPILVDERVVGTFSENTLFSILCNGNKCNIDENSTFDDIREYVDITSPNVMPIFTFEHPDELLTNVLSKFSVSTVNGYRIDTLFITDDGTKESPLLGLVTAWDLPRMINI